MRVCVCVCITSQKYLAALKNFISHPKTLFLIVLFLMKQVKCRKAFIYYTKLISLWATSNTN